MKHENVDSNEIVVAARRAGRGTVAAKELLTVRAREFLIALKLKGGELSILVVDDREIRSINKKWRQIDRPTDVLSFPLSESPRNFSGALGDIVISLETAKRAATEFSSTVEFELSLYLAHGLLHLLGFDHQRPVDARKMAKMERKLLGEGGMLSRSDEL